MANPSERPGAPQEEEVIMFAPRVTEIRRLSAHHRQVAYVRASLLRGINYGDAPPNTSKRTR
jgi:hypothetical protein